MMMHPPSYHFVLAEGADVFVHVGKRELLLLLRMLQDLNHPALLKSANAFGFLGDINQPITLDTATLNEEEYKTYKTQHLRKRVESKKYAFFLLKDENDHTIGLASGNLDDNNLRLLNHVIDPDHRGKRYMISMMKEILSIAAKRNLDIDIPISEFSGRINSDRFHRINQEHFGGSINLSPLQQFEALPFPAQIVLHINQAEIAQCLKALTDRTESAIDLTVPSETFKPLLSSTTTSLPICDEDTKTEREVAGLFS